MILLVALACGPAPALDGTPYTGVLNKTDTDHDGALSEAEYIAAAPPVFTVFAKADLDGNGSLSRAELAELTHHTDPAWYDPALAPKERAAGGAVRGASPAKGRGVPPAISEDAAEQPEGPGSGFDGSGPPFSVGETTERSAGKAPKRPARPPPGSPGPTVGRSPGVAGSRRADPLREVLQFEIAEIVARNPAAVVPDDATVGRAALAGIEAPECVALIEGLRKEAAAAGLEWPNDLGPHREK